VTFHKVKDLLCCRNIVGVTADNALRLHVLLNSSVKLKQGYETSLLKFSSGKNGKTTTVGSMLYLLFTAVIVYLPSGITSPLSGSLVFRALRRYISVRHPRALRSSKQNCNNIPPVFLTLWHPLLPYGYSYKASCARPG